MIKTLGDYGWLFSQEESGVGISASGTFAIISYDIPASASNPDLTWIEIDEQVDGMSMGVLKGYILPLQVSENRFNEVFRITDLGGGFSSTDGCWKESWRNDLSWHNTDMDAPNDRTVQAYLSAISSVDLIWTPEADMTHKSYGHRLAQAAYPFDLTDRNLRSLGVLKTVGDLLGEPPNVERHALILLTMNDD